MLSAFAKLLLVSSSLAPILGAVAIINYSNQTPWLHWAGWVAAALLLVLLCWLMLIYAAKNAQQHSFTVVEFQRTDREVLAFLLAYLLPFVSAESGAFNKNWLVGTYILLTIVLVISHVGAFHFNPVMWLLRYHFYSVKDSDGISQVLISRTRFRQTRMNVRTVRLAHSIYLHIGD